MLKEEMIAKAKEAKSVEELLALAKANNVELTEEEAKAYFAQLNPKSGALDDDELDAVAGGGCSGGESAEAVDPRPVVKYEQLCEDFRCHCGGTIHDFTSFAGDTCCKNCGTFPCCGHCTWYDGGNLSGRCNNTATKDILITT